MLACLCYSGTLILRNVRHYNGFNNVSVASNTSPLATKCL